MKALNSRSTRRTGFTIVEIVIAIAVIAILVTIAMVSYSGIMKSGQEAALKSDLKTAAAELTRLQLRDRTFPENGDMLTASNGTTFTYTRWSSSKYCLEAHNTHLDTARHHITEEDTIEPGGCPPPILPPAEVGGSEVDDDTFFIELITGAYITWGIPVHNGGSAIIDYRLRLLCGSHEWVVTLPTLDPGTEMQSPPQSFGQYGRTGDGYLAWLQHGANGCTTSTSLCGELNTVHISARNAAGRGPERAFTVDPSSC